MKKIIKPLIALGCFLASIFVAMPIANAVQNDFGNVNVSMGHFEDSTTNKALTYKLYKPKTVSETNKAPAVLLLHGYQNDHETSSAYAIELARRGFVCLALDEYGHGSTEISMINRGYVNHKTNFTFGTQNEDGKYVLEVGGQERYKVLMNFSCLSFFNDIYSKSGVFDENGNYVGVDSEANYIKDSSMGGVAAYAYLASLPYVDANYMGITGHSMGTWASWSVAAAYSGGATIEGVGTIPQPKCTVLQCGELFTKDAYSEHSDITFSNVLMLTAKYDEFNYFRDYEKTPVTKDMIKSPLRVEFLNNEIGSNNNGVTTENAEWNKTFGNMNNGTARRCEYLVTNHRLATHDTHAVGVTMDWFIDSMVDGSNNKVIQTKLSNTNLIYMWKEVLTLLSLFAALGMVISMCFVLTEIKFFKDLGKGIEPNPNYEKKGWKWRKGALITIALGGITYPFCTQLGHGLFPLPDTTVFRMTIGNGFIIWYLILIIFMLGFIFVPFWKNRRKNKEYEIDLLQSGLSRFAPRIEEKVNTDASRSSTTNTSTLLNEETEANEMSTTKIVEIKEDKKESKKKKKIHKVCQIAWVLIGKSALLAFLMIIPMYIILAIIERAFNLDFRFIWPFFRTFSLERFGQFLIYLPMFILFYVLNNSAILARNRTKYTSMKGAKGFINTFWRVALSMTGGVLLITLLEYIPFFMQLGPGADLLFSPTFGGPFMSLLIVFVPQVIIFSLIATILYRKTGNVYVGAFIIAILACWIVTGGSAIL